MVLESTLGTLSQLADGLNARPAPSVERTGEEMAKEAAVQEAMIYTGTEAGSPNETLIRMGADSMMDKIKSWWD